MQTNKNWYHLNMLLFAFYEGWRYMQKRQKMLLFAYVMICILRNLNICITCLHDYKNEKNSRVASAYFFSGKYTDNRQCVHTNREKVSTKPLYYTDKGLKWGIKFNFALTWAVRAFLTCRYIVSTSNFCLTWLWNMS